MSSLEALFCDVDDFFQVFEPKWFSHLLSDGLKHRKRAKGLCLSEICLFSSLFIRIIILLSNTIILILLVFTGGTYFQDCRVINVLSNGCPLRYYPCAPISSVVLANVRESVLWMRLVSRFVIIVEFLLIGSLTIWLLAVKLPLIGSLDSVVSWICG